MSSFSPQAAILNMSGRTARRFFRYLDPSIRTDWKDDSILAPAVASDCFDALDKERKDRFFRALGVVSRIASSEANLETLRDRLAAYGVAPAPQPDDLSKAYDLTVDALIEHPDAWRETQYFVDADTLPERRWHVYEVVGGGPDRDPDEEVLGRLAEAVRATWRQGSFGLGRTVKFTYALRNGRSEYYVAEVDDYPRDIRECVDARFVSRLFTPVCGIVLVFDREKRLLRVGTTVPLVKAPSIAENWARVVKGVSLRNVQRYDARPVLENLVDPDRELTLDPEGRVAGVRRTLVKATPFGKPARKTTTEDGEEDALDAFIEEHGREGFDLAGFEILQVKVRFELRTPAGGTKNVTVTVTQKGWSAGNQPTWVHAIVRERLRAWEVIGAAAA